MKSLTLHTARAHGWLATLATLAAACSAAPKRGHTLFEDVQTYNEGIRWGKWGQAARTLPLDERETFMEDRADLVEDLRIVDYEIIGIRYHEGRTRARVDVMFMWHLDSEGIVHKTVARQAWQLRGKFWVLTEETRARGQEMPGLDEAARDPQVPPVSGRAEGGVQRLEHSGDMTAVASAADMNV